MAPHSSRPCAARTWDWPPDISLHCSRTYLCTWLSLGSWTFLGLNVGNVSTPAELCVGDGKRICRPTRFWPLVYMPQAGPRVPFAALAARGGMGAGCRVARGGFRAQGPSPGSERGEPKGLASPEAAAEPKSWISLRRKPNKGSRDLSKFSTLLLCGARALTQRPPTLVTAEASALGGSKPRVITSWISE